jgi:hypothetical protein
MPKHPSRCCLPPKFKDYLEEKISINKEKERDNEKEAYNHSCMTLEYYTLQKAYNLCHLCHKRGH